MMLKFDVSCVLMVVLELFCLVPKIKSDCTLRYSSDERSQHILQRLEPLKGLV